jgi:hypothetical protein
MKKSAHITVTAVAAIGLAACNRGRIDPCEAATFNELACNEAVRNGGYHYRGTWFPMMYSHPYPFYYDMYRNHMARGGMVQPAPSSSYLAPGSHGVTRGGFGATGSSHFSGGSSANGAGA